MPYPIQLKRQKGWRLPPNTVVVARPSRWGNPFRTGIDGTGQECFEMHRLLLSLEITNEAAAVSVAEQLVYYRWAWDHIEDLRGKNLACWCPLGVMCHRDTLLAMANVGAHGHE